MDPKNMERRVRQMHASLANLRTGDVSGITPKFETTSDGFRAEIDFSGDLSEEEILNSVESLINNVACLKDHFNKWCDAQGRVRTGDKLINANRDVALIHDLWNTQKHAVLERDPRSGVRPQLANVKRVVTLGTGTAAGHGTTLSWDPRTGEMRSSVSGCGSVEVSITADIVDESGVKLGGLSEICERAVLAWENELKNAGVAIPFR